MTQKQKVRIIVAILAMEFTSLAMSAVSPALADIGTAFPQVPQMFMSMLSTMPALICMPAGILSNRIAGRIVKFKTLAVSALFCLLIGGLAPFFCNNFYSILVWRMLFGVGMGMIQPLGGTIIFMFFSKSEAELQSSNNTIFNNIGAIVFQLFGGILCAAFGWHTTFLVYLALVPSLFIVLFVMPEPDTSDFVRREKQIHLEQGHVRYGWKVWKWCLLYFSFCVLFYPLVTDSSVIILKNGYGTAAGTSILLTLFTVGGVVGGFLFRFVRNLEKRLFSLIFSICAAGFFLFIIADRLLIMVAGAALFGVGYGLFMAAIMIEAGYCVPQEIRPGVTARLLASAGIGEFFSSFLMAFLVKASGSQYERFPFLFSMAAYLILAVYFFITSGRKETSGQENMESIQ